MDHVNQIQYLLQVLRKQANAMNNDIINCVKCLGVKFLRTDKPLCTSPPTTLNTSIRLLLLMM